MPLGTHFYTVTIPSISQPPKLEILLIYCLAFLIT